MDEILQRFNIRRETLTRDEVETLDKWAKALSTQQMTIVDLKGYIGTMIESIERQLTGFDNPPLTFAGLIFRGRHERHMKARLQNYILLRDFITSPERARQYVEKQLGSHSGVKPA